MSSWVARGPGRRWLLSVGLFLAACGAATPLTPTPAPTATPPPPQPTPSPIPPTVPAAAPTSGLDEEPPLGAAFEFSTDFSQHSVPYAEILSGGPPKGGIGVDRGIAALLDPDFVSVAEADAWLKPTEPVVYVEVEGDARAYPLQILVWHEIVNDTVGGVPLLVTFCPLCNTAIAFERTVGGQVFEFGTTGRLRYSNLIMYDRQTETWWQQATGEAIAGALTGDRLVFRPASIIAWSDFRAAYAGGRVLSRDTGMDRPYGSNPYAGYDDVNRPPFLYRGPATPGVLPPVARVITVDLNGDAVAYPYAVLEQAGVVIDVVGGAEIAVLWVPGASSSFPESQVSGAEGRSVGAANVFLRELEGQRLTLRSDGARLVDEETGSEWNVLGEAVGGPLAGKKLTPVVAINHFWFSWAAFRPDTRVYQP